jgi:hypothetical protein
MITGLAGSVIFTTITDAEQGMKTMLACLKENFPFSPG